MCDAWFYVGIRSKLNLLKKEVENKIRREITEDLRRRQAGAKEVRPLRIPL
jgi:hypothetical protein